MTIKSEEWTCHNFLGVCQDSRSCTWRLLQGFKGWVTMCNKVFVLLEVTRPKRRTECQLHGRFKFHQLQRLRREIQRPSANLKDHAEEVVVISWQVSKAPWSMRNLGENWCKLALAKTWSVDVYFMFLSGEQAIENIWKSSSSLRPSVIPLSFKCWNMSGLPKLRSIKGRRATSKLLATTRPAKIAQTSRCSNKITTHP